MSTSSSSSSSFSEVIFASGMTYYSDFRSYKSISNPILSNNVNMKYNGFWSEDWQLGEQDFDKFGYGLKKVKSSAASIFCEDASKLFSMNEGYLGVVLSFPCDVKNGTPSRRKSHNSEFNSNILWGVNVGRYEMSQPGLLAEFTPDGLDFSVWTSKGAFTMTDNITNVNANENIFYEFFWGAKIIDNPLIRLMLRVDNQLILYANPPMSNDSIEGLNFYLLNTPFGYSNLECTVRKLVTSNKIVEDDIPEVYSSSSSSTSSSSSSSSLSSLSSLGYSSSSTSSSSYSTSSSSSDVEQEYIVMLRGSGNIEFYDENMNFVESKDVSHISPRRFAFGENYFYNVEDRTTLKKYDYEGNLINTYTGQYLPEDDTSYNYSFVGGSLSVSEEYSEIVLIGLREDSGAGNEIPIIYLSPVTGGHSLPSNVLSTIEYTSFSYTIGSGFYGGYSEFWWLAMGRLDFNTPSGTLNTSAFNGSNANTDFDIDHSIAYPNISPLRYKNNLYVFYDQSSIPSGPKLEIYTDNNGVPGSQIGSTIDMSLKGDGTSVISTGKCFANVFQSSSSSS